MIIKPNAMNRWRVYCSDTFFQSFSTGVEALQMAYELVEMHPMGPEGKRPRWRTYNVRLDEITVWEEGDPYEYSRKGR